MIFLKVSDLAEECLVHLLLGDLLLVHYGLEAGLLLMKLLQYFVVSIIVQYNHLFLFCFGRLSPEKHYRITCL